MNARIRFQMHRMGLRPERTPSANASTPPPAQPSSPRVYCDTHFKPRRWWQQRRYEDALSIAAYSVLMTTLIVALAFISRAA